MIQILCVIHKNYDLYDLQLKHWEGMNGEFELLFVDNTPSHLRKSIPGMLTLDTPAFDGESHGQALDYLLSLATSDIVGIMDSDFFWTNKNIIPEVEAAFAEGFVNVGCSAMYPDWCSNIDPFYPDRHHSLAPVVWGMFVDRKLALEQSFVCSASEGQDRLYTGHRLRQRIIRENLPCKVFQGFYPDGHTDMEMVWYGTPEKPEGFHWLKGSFTRTNVLPISSLLGISA